jgi:uncharacterized RDD family membrane protein YckC
LPILAILIGLCGFLVMKDSLIIWISHLFYLNVPDMLILESNRKLVNIGKKFLIGQIGKKILNYFRIKYNN